MFFDDDDNEFEFNSKQGNQPVAKQLDQNEKRFIDDIFDESVIERNPFDESTLNKENPNRQPENQNNHMNQKGFETNNNRNSFDPFNFNEQANPYASNMNQININSNKNTGNNFFPQADPKQEELDFDLLANNINKPDPKQSKPLETSESLDTQTKEIAEKNKQVNFDAILNQIDENKTASKKPLRETFTKDNLIDTSKVRRSIKKAKSTFLNLEKFEKPFGLTKDLKVNDLKERKEVLFKDTYISICSSGFASFSKYLNYSANLKPLSKFDPEGLEYNCNSIREDIKSSVDLEALYTIINSIHLDRLSLEQLNLSPIGNQEEIESIIPEPYQPYISRRSKILLENRFNWSLASFRHITNDGNSFFRAFMFSYLEHLILFRKLFELRSLISELFMNTLSHIKSPQGNLSNVTGMLLCVLNCLEQTRINEAYEFFIKCFIYSSEFDSMILAYIRVSLARYIRKNSKKLAQSDLNYKGLLPKAFITDGFKADILCDSLLLNKPFEQERLFIVLLPFVFEIGLDLFYLEGLHDVGTELISGVESIRPVDSKGNISLVHTFGRFHSGVSQDLASKFDTVFECVQIHSSRGVDSLSFHTDECTICNSHKKCITKESLGSALICIACLGEYINTVISFRSTSLSKESYFNLECTNPLQYRLYKENSNRRIHIYRQ